MYVPDDVIGIQAYILWEKAGRPDGADFSQQARDAIHSQLKSGKDLKVSPPCCSRLPTAVSLVMWGVRVVVRGPIYC